jgi:hypothetical protein
MSPAPPRQHSCSFCARPRDELGEDALLFYSSIGGLPAAICSDCVADLAMIDRANQRAPGLADVIIRAHNIAVRPQGAT